MPEDTEDQEQEDIRPLLTEEFKESFNKKWRLNNDGCWIWTAARDKDDYGQVAVGSGKGRIRRAHRVAYMLYSGNLIPRGEDGEWMDIDHTCHMRRCVNPEHLELVTHATNMKNLRKKNDWAEDDEAFERKNRQTSPEVIMAEALELLRRSNVDGKGSGYDIVSANDRPWQHPAIRDGYMGVDKICRVRLFMDVVRMGVDWKVACKDILEVSTFAVYDWSSNPDWRDDFAAAKREGRRNRYSVLEERHIDEMERKIDFADFKEISDSLKKLREQDEDRIATKKGQDNNGLPNITIVLGANPEKALRALVDMGDEIEAEYTVIEPKTLN